MGFVLRATVSLAVWVMSDARHEGGGLAVLGWSVVTGAALIAVASLHG